MIKRWVIVLFLKWVAAFITPATGTNISTTINTKISGTGFEPGASVNLSKSGQADIIATSVTAVSPTKITAPLTLLEQRSVPGILW